MLKVYAIGDVHANWGSLWRALKATPLIDDQGNPTALMKTGDYQIILTGDLIHPKTLMEYSMMTGIDGFDPENPQHLSSAARSQIRELNRLKRTFDACEGHMHILLGNHDDAALTHKFSLGSGFGTKHNEFDPNKGGREFPEELRTWMESFPREIIVGRTHFGHVGPMPTHAIFDEFFYSTREHKTWWEKSPEWVQMFGYVFGVYGHTVMKEGIHLDPEERFAMIDALETGQILELGFGPDLSQKPEVRILSFKA